jgi:hypothetical protein
MIQAPVLKAVQDLLHESGIEKRADERLSDYIARGLDLSGPQAETFIEALHHGKTVEEAQAEAHIVPGQKNQSLLVDLARRIGSTLGRAGQTLSTKG